jgi:glycosyltransferase involved in cell wall biosynthesis
MYLYVTYELSPFTKGGVGTYMQHIVEEALRTKKKVALLFGISQQTVNRIRDSYASRECNDLLKFYSIYDFAWHRDGPNEFWSKSKMFCESIIEILNLETINYIEFFDYCGPAYHTLCEKALNPALRDIPIAIRIHNTIEVIDRFSGRIQEGISSPYWLEREAIALADHIIIPSMKFWKESANIYDVPPERLVEIPPPFTASLVPKAHDHREGIVFIGRPSVIKGFDTLAEALKLFNNGSAAPPLPDVTIIGPEETVTGALNTTDLAARTGLGARMRVTGHVHPAELRGLIGQFEIAIFPNRTESYCYALHEAHLAGVRIIANAIPAFLAHLEESCDVRFFDGTPSDLARVLHEMLAHDQGGRATDLCKIRDRYIDKPFEALIPPSTSKPILDNSCLLVTKADDCDGQQVWAFARAAQDAAPNVALGFLAAQHCKENTKSAMEALDKLLDNNCSKTIFIATVCREGATPDHVARALRRLWTNPSLLCVLIFADWTEQEILNIGEKILFPENFKIPTAVIWRFSSRAMAYNHFAKNFDQIVDANTLLNFATTAIIGTSDHPSARLYTAARTLMFNIVGKQSNVESLDMIDHRLCIASSLQNGCSFLVLVRGSMRYTASSFVRQLFGFVQADMNSYTSSYGGLVIDDDTGSVEIDITSDNAEIWIYKGGKRSAEILAQGVAYYEVNDVQEPVFNPVALAYEQAGDILINIEDDIEHVFVLHSKISPNTEKRSDSHITEASSIEQIISRIGLLKAQRARVVLYDTHLDKMVTECLLANARHIGRLELTIVMGEGFFYAQNWTMHLALEHAKRIASTCKRFALTIQTTSMMAPRLQALGFITRINEMHQSPAHRYEPVEKRKLRPIRILMSSAGTYAGHYGHQLCALAMALTRHDGSKWRLDIVEPNVQSQKLLADLQLGLNTVQINTRNAKDKSNEYDLVMEIYPDNLISTAACEAVENGAHGLLGRGSQHWFPANEGLSYIDEWEAADRIADELALILRGHTQDVANTVEY